MNVGEAPIGCSGLLRIAGLPIRYWLAGANPNLFAKVARLEADIEARHRCALHLAARIGQQLVPIPSLSREDRAFLLGLRRTLHRGDPIAKVSRERVLNLSGLSCADTELVQALVAMVDRDPAIAILSAEVEADLAREQERLLLLPEETYHESRVAKALLSPRHRAELELGSRLSRKSRRRLCEHGWRCIARAATGSTPRSWLSHIALLPIETADTLSAPTVTEQFTAQWMENVRTGHLALAHPPNDWPAHESRLAVNPLRWDADGSLVCVVLDECREHTQVAVRHTSLLDAICTVLASTIQTFGDLGHALGCVNEDQWLTLRGFVRHLVGLGILQPSAPPRVQLERQAIPGQTFDHELSSEDHHSGWVDVYRYVETGISQNLVRQVQKGVSQVLRVLKLMTEDLADLGRLPVSTSERSWSPTEILGAGFGDEPISKSEDSDFVQGRFFPGPSSSGFDRLVSMIAGGAAHGSRLVIDSSWLDECGAPDGTLTWPVDCLVRVPEQGADFSAVLDELLPAGMLDARFVDTLVDMHGVVPHRETYGAFLREIEQLTGILFVELLLPPLQDGAANAVRRPAYTSAWTGDPHTAAYFRSDTDPGRYIPLNAIRIRRMDGQLRADADGQRIWPIYHATRSFSPPWDRLARLLLATAPLNLPYDFKRMISSLTLLPGQHALPRVLIGDRIVLAPAQWRITSDDLWENNASEGQKVRALIRLQKRYSLPRWLYLDRGNNKRPVPCDLESIQTIRTIERHTTPNAPAKMIEMLPAPDQFLVIDRAHRSHDRLAAQLQLRFPCNESASAMATRLASALVAPPPRPLASLGDSWEQASFNRAPRPAGRELIASI